MRKPRCGLHLDSAIRVDCTDVPAVASGNGPPPELPFRGESAHELAVLDPPISTVTCASTAKCRSFEPAGSSVDHVRRHSRRTCAARRSESSETMTITVPPLSAEPAGGKAAASGPPIGELVARSVCGLVRNATVLSRCDRRADDRGRPQSSEYGPANVLGAIKGEQRDETTSILDQRHARRLLRSRGRAPPGRGVDALLDRWDGKEPMPCYSAG